MSEDEELAKIRDAILHADEALVAALDARAQAVKRYVELRAREPGSYFALPSTAEIVQKALETSTDFPREALERALREILGACAQMIAPIKVAVHGAPGGFAYVAARAHFGHSAQLEAHETVAEVFEDVERKRVSFGMVPFETSSDGALADTLDGLVKFEPRICAELTIPSTYDLVSRTGNAGDVEKIYGTAAALAACEAGLRRAFPKAALLDVRSALVAADFAAEDHGAAAVVAGFHDDETDGQGRNLRRVLERVEDKTGVHTRFVVIGHERPRRTSRDRTILALAVGDEPGSLYHALQPFADRGINLTRIESRSAMSAGWRYLFILELDGHMTDRGVLTAVDEVRNASRHLKILGSFPRPSE